MRTAEKCLLNMLENSLKKALSSSLAATITVIKNNTPNAFDAKLADHIFRFLGFVDSVFDILSKVNRKNH